MLNLSQEKVIYHALRENTNFYNVTKPNYFSNNDIKIIFALDKEFTEKYRNVPSKHQILQILTQRDIKEITENKLDSIFDEKISEYDKDWVDETLKYWIEYQTLLLSVIDLTEYMQTTKVDASNIKHFVQSAKNIITERNNLVLDFDFGLDFFDPENHKQFAYDRFSSGYPFIDRCLGGGFKKKSLVVFMGRSKIGKSIWLSNLAANVCKTGINTAYVSFELGDRSVIKRLGSNLLDVPMDRYDEFAEQTTKVKNRLDLVGSDMLTSVPGELIVKEYPASSSGVPDIERFLQKLEEVKGKKFDFIVIDYINIMMDWRSPNSDNTYLKIKRIAEDLRAMATRNNWAIVSVTQITRDGFGSNDITTSNISESVGLLNTVDALFGIIQDPIMLLQNTYSLKALALRDAPGIDERQDYNIDYSHMKITEKLETSTSANSYSDFDDLTK